MDNQTGIFVGYKSFYSPKSNRDLYIISLLFIELDEEKQIATNFIKDIFTDKDSYNNFVKSHSLLSSIEVKREIVGDQVRYYI